MLENKFEKYLTLLCSLKDYNSLPIKINHYLRFSWFTTAKIFEIIKKCKKSNFQIIFMQQKSYIFFYRHKQCTASDFTPVVIQRIVSSVPHGWSTYQPTCGKLTKLLRCTLWGYRINSDFNIEFSNLFMRCMTIIHFNKCIHTKMEFNWFWWLAT